MFVGESAPNTLKRKRMLKITDEKIIAGENLGRKSPSFLICREVDRSQWGPEMGLRHATSTNESSGDIQVTLQTRKGDVVG